VCVCVCVCVSSSTILGFVTVIPSTAPPLIDLFTNYNTPPTRLMTPTMMTYKNMTNEPNQNERRSEERQVSIVTCTTTIIPSGRPTRLIIHACICIDLPPTHPVLRSIDLLSVIYNPSSSLSSHLDRSSSRLNDDALAARCCVHAHTAHGTHTSWIGSSPSSPSAVVVPPGRSLT
jgi:hypothetical protein